MNKIVFRKYWLLCPLIFSGCFTGRQYKLDRIWPEYGVFSMSREANAYVREGYILKKNGDTLKGYIRMIVSYEKDQTISNVPLLPYGKKNKTDIIRVSLDDIDYVRISTMRGKSTDDYMPIQSVMWQVLGRKDAVSVCFQVFEDNPSPYTGANGEQLFDAVSNEKMAVVSRKNVIRLFDHVDNIFSQKDIVGFINKRYDKKFKKKDFKGRNAFVKCILELENARIADQAKDKTATGASPD